MDRIETGFRMPWVFTIWIILNLADTLISYLAVSNGAREIGILYQVNGSFLTTLVSKMILVILVGLALVYFKQNRLLRALNIGISLVCIYGACVLLKQTGII